MMADIDELENIYQQETGNNFSFFSDNGIPMTEIPTLLFFYDLCNYETETAANCFIRDYRKAEALTGALKPHIIEFYGFYTKKVFGNPEYHHFLDLSAKIYLSFYTMQPEFENYKEELYQFPKKHISFVDVCSGFNFILFFPVLQPTTRYYVIDKSLFTCACISQAMHNMDIHNVVVLNKDIQLLSPDDFDDEVFVVRANNIWRYIQDFHNHINFFKSLIKDGGVFLFQEYSSSKVIVHPNGPYNNIPVDKYFSDGWKKELTLNMIGGNVFDSLVYKKIPALLGYSEVGV